MFSLCPSQGRARDSASGVPTCARILPAITVKGQPELSEASPNAPWQRRPHARRLAVVDQSAEDRTDERDGARVIGADVDLSVPREELADRCVHDLRMRHWAHVSQRLELHDLDLRENLGQQSGHAAR